MSEVGESILRGAREALDHAKGGKKAKASENIVYVPEDVDVKGIRERAGMSQRQFAEFYGIKLTALQAWEQGRRKPGRTARILFTVLEKNPRAIREALAA